MCRFPISVTAGTALHPAFAQASVVLFRPSVLQRQPARWQASAAKPARRRPPASNSKSPRTFRLAPSDFAFLWEECKRCFYLKAHGKLYRPRAPFPSIFGTIDGAMKHHFRGLTTTDLLPEMSPGVFLCEDDDAWVESMPITPPNHTNSVFIRGMVSLPVVPVSNLTSTIARH